MKKPLIILSVLLLTANSVIPQIAINKDGSPPATGAILHVKGTGNNELYVDDANGNVGIGTTDPESKLEVDGTIHSSSGGFKFPDGTSQTSAIEEGGWQHPPIIVGGAYWFGGAAIESNGDLYLFEWRESDLDNSSWWNDKTVSGPFVTITLGFINFWYGGSAIKSNGDLYLFEWRESDLDNSSWWNDKTISGPFN